MDELEDPKIYVFTTIDAKGEGWDPVGIAKPAKVPK